MEAGQGKDWVFGTHRHFAVEPSAPAENSVTIIDYSLMPATITVTVGTEVSWANQDVVLHTITGASFNSGALRIKATYRYTFEQPGEYKYFCAIHPSMTGKVVVTEE
jgi:plastocyanin